ncbi:hypothetical protein [Acinetobacter sp. ANC 3882]|uniref:hypothetical protein n=1 Tax=Acinetobacter sp. ANC 3882 TaxID=2923423 RepID=UPI001F4A4B50|nr:hypothetical protein [Acinetobacter sp. ANC 3882]MCH7315806.1 hypothetical protein [Acinetobacter sp. ANC 3882]
MIDFKKDWGKLLAFVVLLLASIGLVLVQVFNLSTPTKLEIALVSALQYICSIGFTWLLSIIVFNNSYKDKQKKFAIGAFRRVKEIERNIKRTQAHIDHSLKNGNDLKSCLAVAKFSLINAQDTINSSISDWADIIEDELEISAQIEKLESSSTKNIKDEAENDSAKQEIESLTKKLPPELRHKISAERSKQDQIEEAVIYLGKKIIKDEFIELRGFWEPRNGFMTDLTGIIVGSKIYIARGITDTRTGAILMYNEAGESLAVVTNCCSELRAPYDVFAEAIDNVFGRTLRPKMFGGHPVQAEVIKIEDFDPKLERQYLYVRVFKGLDDSIRYKYKELKLYNKSSIEVLT